MTLCLVTDRHQLSPDARTPRDQALALARWLEEAVAARIDLIQLRERDLPARLLCELARTVRMSAAGSKTRVVVNDRADVAVAAECDGVHLRGESFGVARVRALDPSGLDPYVGRPGFEGRQLIVGRSVHSESDAVTHADADYLLFGSVFDSGPKPGRGLDALREVVSAAVAAGRGRAALVLAIGGVTPARASACMNAGAAGVAAIKLFLPPGRASGALGISAGAAALRGAIDASAIAHVQ